MAAYCPTCRGLMRPQGGTLVCISCSARGRARTVLSGGRRINLAGGQQSLGAPAAAASGFDATLEPQAPSWSPQVRGSPHPQLGLFPYDTIRDGQKRFTRDVLRAVELGRHLVAQAPTGIGKTAASLAPALQIALEKGKTILFLTSRKSQHRIAIETLRAIESSRGVRPIVVDLVAKRDMCLRREANEMHPARFPDFCAQETRTRSCQFLGEVDPATLQAVRTGILHVEELMHVSKQAHLCPHMVALAAAKQANVVVADYNHLFSDLREQALSRLGKNLEDLVVIVDEAHNLPDRIRQNHAHRVTPFLLDAVEAEARGQKARVLEQDLAGFRLALSAIAANKQADGTSTSKRTNESTRVAPVGLDELALAFEAARNRGTLGGSRSMLEFTEDLRELATKLKKGADDTVHADELAEALEDWRRFQKGALRFVQWSEGAVELHIRLLDASIPAKTVFERVHSAILMSGTLRPPEMARDLLGLPPERTEVRVYPSPFDPAHRMVVAAQGITTRFVERSPELWSRIATTIADLAAATAGNVAVFTPSYAILTEVKLALGAAPAGKELIIEEPSWTKADRDRVLDTLEGARRRKGALLLGVMGASLSEGVDYKDNLLSALVIVGLPIPPPDLELDATIGYLDARFPGQGRLYGSVVPTMNRVLQAMGRPIRGPNDKCAILLLDERFLGPPYKTLLPDGVLASRDPVAAVAPFLKAYGL
ncbi:MAG: helicase C-terminal domain-containing protein [Candidatus Thermoplasmatota archaeon]